MGEVYVITNTKNGMQYVGQTMATGEKRLRQCQSACKTDNRTKIVRAMNEFGPESFTVETLERLDDRKMLVDRETYWINKLGTLHPDGYNVRIHEETRTGVQGRKLEELRTKHPEVAAEIIRRRERNLAKYTDTQVRRWTEFNAKYPDVRADIMQFKQVMAEMKRRNK